MWIVTRRPVEIDGRSFYPANVDRDADIIPAELESKMDENHRKSCIRVADGALNKPSNNSGGKI